MTEWGKGGVWSCRTNLMLHNQNHDGMWFFVSRGFDEEIADTVEIWRVDLCCFTSNTEQKFLDFYGTPELVAFYLPANARMSLQGWEMESLRADVTTLHIVAAGDFSIDGNNELENEWFSEKSSAPIKEQIDDAINTTIMAYKKYDKENPSILVLDGVIEKLSISVDVQRILHSS